ncbi:hypothetical protein HPP92_022764 [Vanilla planifolia]|uniref:Uncharacterized protein n=1 Tax=Vanilla planifolia TaxID=51239 RepID=A0A835PSR5_VANPL|nr:hypothetical protein HPP92_022764 [Vanilla planifolia]
MEDDFSFIALVAYRRRCKIHSGMISCNSEAMQNPVDTECCQAHGKLPNMLLNSTFEKRLLTD